MGNSDSTQQQTNQNQQQNRVPPPPPQQQQQQQAPPASQQEAYQRQVYNSLYTNQALQAVNPFRQYQVHFGSMAGQGSEVHRAGEIKQQAVVPIQNDIMIDTKSFRFIVDENDPTLLKLTFKMNFQTEAAVGIYYSAAQQIDQRNLTLNVIPDDPNYQPNRFYKFQPCKDFDYPKDLYPLSLKAFSPTQLFRYNAIKFPIIIKIEKIDKSKELKFMYHYLAIKLNAGHYEIEQVGQKLELNGVGYQLQDIFGIADSKLNDKGVESEQKDCIICMCEKLDTIIVPAGTCACAKIAA